ncbi:MAG: hypothetical protein PWQ78_630 [Petrotoga sp.]|nr:hypothetical protein [Petrotoga sp.]
MNNLGLKFNIYDQIGYLLVGTIGLLIIYFNSILLNIYYLPEPNLSVFIVWIVIAYFLGHLIQAMANIFVKEKKEDFSESEKQLLNIARDFFEVKNLSDGEVWNLCYMLGVAKDPSGQIQAFNAYYSLYRGWFIVFLAETIFLSGYIFFFFSLKNLTLWVVSGLIAFLFFLRLKRFYYHLKNKVFQTFIIIIRIDFKEK